mmetsp:Transcript_588/g.2148  ORF Transcript_588/g.2148 Transcript_588/m.2148 type:complete len:306 (-) Transcript_588:315-1232(-)
MLLELLARLDVRVVVARVVDQFPVLDAHDVRAHAVHEVLRVADHQQDPVPIAQVVLQPNHSLHVQVVRRLVEEKQGGLDEERSRKGDAHSPSTGELLCLLLLHLRSEAETVKDLRRAHLGSGSIHVIEAVVQALESFHDVFRGRLVHVLASHQVVELLGLGLQASALLVDGDDRFQRGHLRGLDLLAKVEEVDALRNRHSAAAQHVEQRALPASVPTDQAVAIAEVDHNARLLQNGAAVEQHRHVADVDVSRVRVQRSTAVRVRHDDIHRGELILVRRLAIVHHRFGFPLRRLQRLRSAPRRRRR